MTAWELTEAFGETEEELLEPLLTAPVKKKLSRPIRTALILAAVIALLALAGVLAREAGYLDRLFPEEKFETIEEYVNHIAVSVENDSLRLTLHEAVTDGYNTLLVYSVEVLQGSPEDWEGYSPDKLIRPLTEEGYPVQAGGVDQPLDIEDGGMGNPNRAVRLWYGKTEMNLGRISVRLFGLKNWTTGETFTPGYLEAEAELKPCLTKVSRDRGDGEGVYSNIVLSPFGLRADVAGMDMEKLGRGKGFRGKLEYVYREGEEEQQIIGSPALRPDPVRQDVAVMSVRFRQPVDIRGIAAVRIDGTEYPLETGPIPELPQRPLERSDIPGSSDVPELSGEERRALYESLFADCSPAAVEYVSDNGVYRMELRTLALWGDESELHLRAWVTVAVKEGAYDRLLDTGELVPYACMDGKELSLGISINNSRSFYDRETGERVFALNVDYAADSARHGGFDGDYGKVTALRLSYTPPKGDWLNLVVERTA